MDIVLNGNQPIYTTYTDYPLHSLYMENHYKVLGLKRGASLKEISAAYRSQALIHHPDKRKQSTENVNDNDEVFFKIKAAYQALQDPKTRAELDLHLIGQEERVLREAQMSKQRKMMRDELLSREREAQDDKRNGSASVDTQSKSTDYTPKNEDACLKLKCKFPSNLKVDLALEMLKSSLAPFSLLNIHKSPSNDTSVIAEFKDSQSAYKALCTPNDLVSMAEWYKGYPPEGLEISFGSSSGNKPEIVKVVTEKVKYSKDLEMSVLERLRQKKKQKMKEDTSLEKNS